MIWTQKFNGNITIIARGNMFDDVNPDYREAPYTSQYIWLQEDYEEG
jgi:hypothetical protein